MTGETKQSVQSGSGMLFPVPMSEPMLQIGQGFDMIAGEALSRVGLTPGQKDLIVTHTVASESQYFYIKDSSSFDDAFEFSMTAGGGGWGASYGLTASVSALLQTSSLTQSIHFRGVTKQWQAVVPSNIPLAQDAAALLAQKGTDAFIAEYGTHFVAGYVYGRSCNLSYNLNFSTLSLATQFSEAYNESVSELGFSDKLDTSISNALKQSNSQCEMTVSSYLQGFEAPAPQNLEDLAAVVGQYAPAGYDPSKDQYDPNATPIFYVVYPWTYLDAVQSAAGLDLGSTVQQLAKLTNQLTYIANSCDQFLGSHAYTGATQLAATRTVRSTASQEVSAIVALLSSCNASGTVPTQADVDNFSPAEEQYAQMTTALSRFLLAFSAEASFSVGGGFGWMQISDELSSQQSRVSVLSSPSSATVTSTAGVWLDWSLAGNDGWAGTSGTQSKRHDLGKIGEGPQFWGDGAIVLDAAKGTVQVWCCQADSNLDGNPRSNPFTIIGSTSAGPLDESNPSYFSWQISVPGDGDTTISILVKVCPM